MPTREKKSTVRPQRRLEAQERRKQIVAAAFETIAEEGFEGLRTRDIAHRAGINIATLHHHFATKEDLVAAVALHLEERLRSEKSPLPPQTPSALGAFESQFQDVALYHLEKPDILAVYREFVGRAPRDPAIRELVERLHGAWRAGIVDALTRGRREGSLRADIDIQATAGLILSAAWGLVSQIFTSTTQLDAAATQLKAWILSPPAAGSVAAKRRRK